MLRKILIANRGEIVVRIARTLQQMGITAVGVYSEPDRNSAHVGALDEAYPLEGSTSGETYLRAERLLQLARIHHVDAIHPGYGFLSENAAFAQACADAGFTFIGPTPEVIRTLGDKVIAKERMQAAGVPTVPGWSGAAASMDVLRAEADRIGYPVLIKAAAGGGGKGMRVVEREADLLGAIEGAQREANAAFGDSRVFLEKYLARARHVEIQIFGDTHGNVVHLYERECSIQRRHQKIIEESPSVAVSESLRQRMGEAGAAAGRAVGYTNAGTVEFLLDETGEFYFLEVNTRLQVEHPVTEMILGEDLVRAQVLVAAGEPLPFTQESLTRRGHAVECRIYAEDAARGFLPSTGTLAAYVPPRGDGIRVDDGVRPGGEVSVYYDPMLAKLICWADTREAALAKMRWALDRYVVLGVTTNIPFLRALMDEPAFVAGRIHTRFLDEKHIEPLGQADQPPDEAFIAAALAARSSQAAGARGSAGVADAARERGPWQNAGAWRGC